MASLVFRWNASRPVKQELTKNTWIHRYPFRLASLLSVKQIQNTSNNSQEVLKLSWKKTKKSTRHFWMATERICWPIECLAPGKVNPQRFFSAPSANLSSHITGQTKAIFAVRGGVWRINRMKNYEQLSGWSLIHFPVTNKWFNRL